MKNRPNVVFLGGIETGKTTAIQLLWEEEAVSLKEYDGFMEIGVHEMIPGREPVDFDVIEIPRIHYTSDAFGTKATIMFETNLLVLM